MWNYSDNVVDHFLHPRNVGEIENPDGVGEVGSMACGDMLHLSFKLDDEGRISDAKFKTFGCASAIASSSALTEMIKGKTIEEALTITNRDIADYLGGLPDQKMHCSVLGREALEAAVRNYRGEEEDVKQLEGEVVCTCFGVTDTEIRDVVRENNLTTIEEVTNFTKAGGGCGLCHEKIQEILDEAGASNALPAKHSTGASKASSAHELTNLQKIHLIEEVINERIRPALQHDGGDIELVDVNQNIVTVRLKGACATCPSSSVTMRQFVEKEIDKLVAPDIRVEEAHA